MDKSCFLKIKKNLNNKSLKKFKKELRENIIKVFEDERKTNENLDKILYRHEKYMFGGVMEYIDLFNLELENCSELRDLIWLYSSLLDIKKN